MLQAYNQQLVLYIEITRNHWLASCLMMILHTCCWIFLFLCVTPAAPLFLATDRLHTSLYIS